tara:strand:+ start:157 stop:513 length:357 start_codon:yes stop_codon:yes gene_type:complete
MDNNDTMPEDMFVSVDTDGLLGMIKESTVLSEINYDSTYVDIRKLEDSIDPDGIHIFFNAENIPNRKNQLNTMWWVKTIGEEEPVIMVFKVPQKSFTKYSKIISAVEKDGEIKVDWYD